MVVVVVVGWGVVRIGGIVGGGGGGGVDGSIGDVVGCMRLLDTLKHDKRLNSIFSQLF